MKDTIKNQNTASTSKENTEWCTIKEAHEISGYSTTKIREWVDNGFIKSIKDGVTKVNINDLFEHIAKNDRKSGRFDKKDYISER